MTKPIPKAHQGAFKAYMDAHDNDELPDGAWFQVLEVAAEQFMKDNKIRGDANDAVHQYLEMEA
jgi:hypothetical protein